VLLDRYDQNRDGMIQESEVSAQLKGLFRRLDQDRNNVLSPEELQRLVKARR